MSKFRRQLMMASLVEPVPPTPPLPYDAEVEYLESTGTQYIDTGITPAANLSFSVTYQNSNSGGTTPGYGNVFGARYASQDNEYQVSQYSSGTVSIGTRNNNLGFNSTSKTTIEFNGSNTVTINGGTTKTVTTSAITKNTGSIILFGIRNGGTVSQLQAGKIYAVSFGSVRDYIPVRVGQVGYMYDRVSGQLFGNAGTGDFILGNDV